MRKIVILVFMMLFVLTLVSCGEVSKTEVETFEQQETDEKDETIELVEVDSIVLKDNFGNEHVITKESSFYEVLGLLNIEKNNYSNCKDRIVTIESEIKFGDSDKHYIDGKFFVKDENTTYWDLETHTKKSDVLKFQQYDYSVHYGANEFVENVFSRHQYKGELAINGLEYSASNGTSTYNRYSGNYPIYPLENWECYELYKRTNDFIGMFTFFELFKTYDDITFNGKTYSLEEHVNRSFKLYEDCIIFEQTSPFGMYPKGIEEEKFVYYNGCIGHNCELTQIVKFNIETKNIEYVEVSGKTLSTYVAPLLELEIDVTFSLEQFDSTIYNKSLNDLIDFVKENAAE